MNKNKNKEKLMRHINCFEQIKIIRYTKIMVIFQILLFFLFFSQNVLANQNAQKLPAKYVEILSHFSHVRQNMEHDISIGKSQKWKKILQQGINKYNSLYWWLLSDWYYHTNQKTAAYKSAVRALVITKLEMGVCGSDKELKWVLNQVSKIYVQSSKIKVSQKEIKQSILHSIFWAQKMTDQKTIVHGMSCYMKDISDAQNSSHRRKIHLEDMNSYSISKIERRSRIKRQENALEKIKKEFSYKKVFKNSNANQIWNSTVKNKQLLSDFNYH